MGKKHKQKKKVHKLAEQLSSQCQITGEQSKPSTSTVTKPLGKTVLKDEIDPQVIAKWPKLKLKVPPVFLHKPLEFEEHVRQLLNMGIKFYKPHLGKNYIKVTCETFNDHKHFIHYLDNHQLFYHTFGHPSKRKMKVVIRGLQEGTDINKVKEELKSASIPIIRVHQMKTSDKRLETDIFVLAVVPYDEDGKVILRVSQILGHQVTLEPPKVKPRQCHRCQKWGHSQRYCHGQIRCVKCGEEHLSKKCEKPADVEPTCANCREGHTASYRKCIFTPGSDSYQMMQTLKILPPRYNQNEIVTMENLTTLYKNVDYTKKPILEHS